jgi:hypothetical protein
MPCPRWDSNAIPGLMVAGKSRKPANPGQSGGCTGQFEAGSVDIVHTSFLPLSMVPEPLSVRRKRLERVRNIHQLRDAPPARGRTLLSRTNRIVIATNSVVREVKDSGTLMMANIRRPDSCSDIMMAITNASRGKPSPLATEM